MRSRAHSWILREFVAATTLLLAFMLCLGTGRAQSSSAAPGVVLSPPGTTNFGSGTMSYSDFINSATAQLAVGGIVVPSGYFILPAGFGTDLPSPSYVGRTFCVYKEIHIDISQLDAQFGPGLSDAEIVQLVALVLRHEIYHAVHHCPLYDFAPAEAEATADELLGSTGVCSLACTILDPIRKADVCRYYEIKRTVFNSLLPELPPNTLPMPVCECCG